MEETKQTDVKTRPEKKQNVVSREQASIEVHEWLTSRKIRKRRIDEYHETVDELIDAVVDGDISFDGDNLVFHFADPIGEQNDITKLVFKPRIDMKNVRQRLKKVPSNDVDGRVMAYVGSATNTSSNVLDNISTTDWSLIQSITVFFM